MNLPDFLTEHVYGEIRLTAHRIGLYTVTRLEVIAHARDPMDHQDRVEFIP
jgi:hypothetical protein